LKHYNSTLEHNRKVFGRQQPTASAWKSWGVHNLSGFAKNLKKSLAIQRMYKKE